MKKYLILVLIVLLIGALTVGVLADKKGLQPLDQTPVYFVEFTNKEGDDLVDFYQTADPVWGTDFDISLLKKSAGGQTVHGVGELVEDYFLRYYFKPYVLIHRDDGFYSSQGQVINYQFTEGSGVEAQRCVVTTWLQLDEDGHYDWMVFRADYYARVEGAMEYYLTNIYVIWAATELDTMPGEASEALTELQEAGPANVGGQRPIAP